MVAIMDSDVVSVAITGLSCRFPGDGENPTMFWDAICNGKSARTEVPASRWKSNGFWSANQRRNMAITKSGHFIHQDISTFDAAFFGISSAEAAAMDPQHRLMTEVAYEAVESSGLPLNKLQGSRTGVWIGHFTSDYKELLYSDVDAIPPFAATSLQKTSLANRISWLWDLHGPSITLDTACSSSLVALHLACQSLQTGETDMAIVGGSNLLLRPDMFVSFGGQGFLSPDGKSKAFDLSADGYGRGEGFGAVVLKRVDDAIRDSDPIRAIVRGTACNQDGHTKGFTMPSSEAQTRLIRETYANAHLDFDETGYVEAHGTGTQAGDTEEALALSQTLSTAHSAANKLLIGSVKTNIGHLEAAAGIAAVIKSVLILENGIIPPSIHFHTPNPNILFDDWNLKVPTSMTLFPRSKANNELKRISVNSFGYGGTNAHAIIDDAASYLKSRAMDHALHNTKPAGGGYRIIKRHNTIENTATGSKTRKRLYPITSQDRNGLVRTTNALTSYLRSSSFVALSKEAQFNFLQDLSFTLSKRRSLFQWKTYFVASSSRIQDLVRTLENNDTAVAKTLTSRVPRLGFVFTGQGAQWPGMGMELFEAYPVFRASVESAAAYLQDELSSTWSVVRELRETAQERSRVSVTEYSQPLCTILQVALVDLLRDWGIHPQSVIGHSSGEIGAAYCMGALSRESAWRIAFFRGTLATVLKVVAPDVQGAMMALGLGHDAALAMITRAGVEGQATAGCINSPSSVTISGDAVAVGKMLAMADQEGIFARKLHVDTAYHSPHMQIVSQDYMDLICELEVEPTAAESKIRMYSTLTGAVIDDPEDLDAAHWVKNLIMPVQFAGAIQNLVRPLANESIRRSRESDVDILVEIGPHRALHEPTIQSLRSIGVTDMPYLSVLRRNENAVDTALEFAGILFSHGFPIDFSVVNQDNASGRIPQVIAQLPSYQWNHSQAYWAESRLAREFRLRDYGPRSLIGAPCPTMSTQESIWRGFLRLEEQPWLGDHKINGSVLYPAAGFLTMAIEGARQLAFDQSPNNPKTIRGFRLRHVQLTSALIVPVEKGRQVEYTLSLQPEPEQNWYRFTVASSSNGQSLTRNCIGSILTEYERSDVAEEDPEMIAMYQMAVSSCSETISPEEFYDILEKVGLQYGSTFKNVASLSSSPNTAVGTITIPNVGFTVDDIGIGPEDLYQKRPHIVHPTFLDAVFHLCFAALMGGGKKMTSAMVPTQIGEIYLSARLPIDVGKLVKSVCHARKAGLKNLEAEMSVIDEEESRSVLTIRGLFCSQVDLSTSVSPGDTIAKKYASQMVWRPHLELLSIQSLKQWIQSKAKTAEGIWSEYIKLLHHINPCMSVLEFAIAGLPQMLVTSLDSLATNVVLNTAKYTVCTHSDAAADAIRSKLESASTDHKNLVNVAVLDFLSDPPTQLPDSTLPRLGPLADLIVATSLVFKTPKVAEIALRMVRTRLSGKGRFLFIEQNPDDRSISMDLAHHSGLVLEAEFEADTALVVVLKPLSVAENQQTGDGKVAKQVTLLTPSSSSKAVETFSKDLDECLSSAGFISSIVRWDPTQTQSLQGQTIISMLELEDPFWQDLFKLPGDTGEANFLAARDMILSSGSMFWVTALQDPAAQMVTGIARVVRNENPGFGFCTVDIHDDLNKRAASLVSKIFQGYHVTQLDDTEFKVEDDVVKVNRVVLDDTVNDTLNRLLNPDKARTMRFADVTLGSIDDKLCLRLAIERADELDSLHFLEEQLSMRAQAESELEDDEVEISIKASCVSAADLATVKGRTLLDPSILGMEASGVITRIGSKDIQGRLKQGDRVMVLAPGSHRTLLRTKAGFVGKVPSGVSFEEAACLPLALATAWHALIDLAKLSSSNRGPILIHDVMCPVGHQSLRIARYLGISTFVSVESASEADLVVDTLQIKRSNVLTLSSINVFTLGSTIKQITLQSQGFDVVVDCSGSLTGEALRQTWTALAPFGHFIQCSMGNNDTFLSAANSADNIYNMNKNSTASFVDIISLRSRPDLLAELLQQAFQFLHEDKAYSPVPVRSFPVSSVTAAFREMEAGSVGRAVLTYSATDVVPARLAVNPSYDSAISTRPGILDPNAIYVLSGGLGGLGRSLSTLLVNSLGARKILFLSRSGAKSLSARQLIADLEASEASPRLAAYACDISDRHSLEHAVLKAEAELDGKVKGVIQCAMVLRDVLWSNMSYEHWIDSTRPKVQGTSNLSTLLSDVDFFVSLSSFAGIFGNRGQTNYAAGNCYQDALARHRHQSLGLRSGFTVALPIIRGIGVLAETGMVDFLRAWEGPYGIGEAEFHQVMTLAIRRDMGLEPDQSNRQLILGIGTGASALAAGIEIPYYLKSEAKFSIMERTDQVFLVDSQGSSTAYAETTEKQQSIQAVLSRAPDIGEASDAITQALVKRVAKMQRLDPEDVDPERFLHTYGVDSLLAIEIMDWASKELKSSVNVFQIMASISIKAFAEQIASRSRLIPREVRDNYGAA